MIKIKYTYLAAAVAFLALGSCSQEHEADVAEQTDKAPVTFDASKNLQSDIVPFTEDGAPQSRANFAGDQFQTNDLIKIRIVAPFSPSNEWGEYTDGNTHDNFWILRWTGNNLNAAGNGATWTNVPSSKNEGDFKFDLNSDYLYTSSSNIWTLSQNTPYVFTASTWTEEIHAQMPDPGKTSSTTYTWFYNVFKADQRALADYKSSDVLWAQQFMQTGTQNVRLSFEHKMSALCVDISAFAFDLDMNQAQDSIYLTLENMPDIDQQEIVIGNYYAGAIKSSYRPKYGDWQRTACDRDKNGTVLGISVINEAQEKVEQKSIESCPQTATYTAFNGGDKKFYFIIPPYTVEQTDGSKLPTLWLRQGTKRWSAKLTLPEGNTFKSGVRYTVKMTK